MQEHQPQSRDLILPSFRIRGAHSTYGRTRVKFAALTLMAVSMVLAASAQATNDSKSAHVAEPTIVNIWPGAAPGSEKWTQKEATLGSGPMQRIVNLTTPTLTAYLPDPAKATGTAVIIAPGGGFIFLGTDTHEIAEWLADHGIAGFVLKYRTAPLEGKNETQLNQAGGARFGAQSNNHASIAEDGKYGIADGIQSIKVVREHAAEWGISPNRIVLMGFSAGGMITEYAAINADVSARPNYAAPIYGAPFPVPPIPKEGLPPLLMEMAQDDTVAGPQIVAFYDALKAAGYKPEFHIYEHGGHGWTMRKQGTTSDHWLEEFYWWLEAQGLTKLSR